MHNRPRPAPGAPRDARKEAAQAQRLALYQKLAAKVLAANRSGVRSEAAWAAAGKLAELNPDCYTAWNLRRRCHAALALKGGVGAERALCADERRLTEAALRRNPKAYSAWHHRRWLVARTLGPGDAARELALCGLMLDADERNFHCWGYRRYVVALAAADGDASAASELQYARSKIAANFSNYSAWHARSAALTEAEKGGGCVDEAAEYELVKGAFFTDPEDQSAFFYYRWLVGRTLRRAAEQTGAVEGAMAAAAAAGVESVLAREVCAMRELLELEPGAKWAALTLARLQAARAALPGANAAAAQAMRAETAQILDRLAAEDPMRRGYYASCADNPWESQAAAVAGVGGQAPEVACGAIGAVPSFAQRASVRQRLAASLEAMRFFNGSGATGNTTAGEEFDAMAEAREIEAAAALGAASSGGGYLEELAMLTQAAVAR